MNKPLVKQIYAKNASLYKDLRKFDTVNKMTQRIIKLQNTIKAIPKIEQTKRNRKYRKMALEYQMVHFKREIYREEGVPQVSLIKYILQKTSTTTTNVGGTPEEEKIKKEQHLLPILNLMLIDKSDDELQAMI